MPTQNKSPYHTTVSTAIRDACIELFQSVKAPIQFECTAFDTESKNAHFSHSGILGFAGEDMKGALSICCNVDVLKVTHPLTRIGEQPTDESLNDWMGELSNQLLGRIKNSLLRYGVSFDLSTPTIVKGHDVNVLSVDGAPLLVTWFRSGNSQIAVSFCALIRSGVDFDKIQNDSGPALKEGGDILF